MTTEEIDAKLSEKMDDVKRRIVSLSIDFQDDLQNRVNANAMFACAKKYCKKYDDLVRENQRYSYLKQKLAEIINEIES